MKSNFTLSLLLSESSSINHERQAIYDAPAVYIVQPNKENIDLIVKDCADQKYEKIYLNFLQPISRTLLEDLAQSIINLQDQNMNKDIGLTKVCYRGI